MLINQQLPAICGYHFVKTKNNTLFVKILDVYFFSRFHLLLMFPFLQLFYL